MGSNLSKSRINKLFTPRQSEPVAILRPHIVEDVQLSEVSESIDLNEADAEDAISIDFKGEMIGAKVYSVYDGDSVRIIYKSNRILKRTALRILGIDTPEKRPKKRTDVSKEEALNLKDAEKRAANICTLHVCNLILDKIVQVVLHEHDKYGGRILADLYIDNVLLSDILYKEGYARKYNGEKKKGWTMEELTTGPYN